MIHYIQIHAKDKFVQEIYRAIKKDFGFLAEPFTLHTPSPPLLAGAWILIREGVLVGDAPRHIKEAVAVAVSQTNQCPYCVDAHTIMLHADGQHELAQAVLNEEEDDIIQWAKNPQQPPPKLPYLPEIATTIVAFHYINRMVHVFLDDSPLLNLPATKRVQRRLVGLGLRRAVRKNKQIGISLQLLSGVGTLPPAFCWAKNNLHLSEALIRWSTAIEQAGIQVLSANARRIVRGYLANWKGDAMPMGVQWLEEMLKNVPEAILPEVRFLLLVSLASHRLTPQEVAQFRDYHPSDNELVVATSWAGYMAACRIGELIHLSA